MDKLDKAIWENLEPISNAFEKLIISIENSIGESNARASAIQKLNAAYQDIVAACREDQEYRDREKLRK